MTLPSRTSSSTLSVLTQSLDGYRGYEDVQQRERSDSELRRQLTSRIASLLKGLAVGPNAAQPKDQERLDELFKSSRRKLLTITESLNSPTYKGVPFFVKDNQSPKQLARIYKFEETMLSELGSLAEEVSAVNQDILERDVFEDHFLHIQDFIDSFNQALFEREALILGNEGMI